MREPIKPSEIRKGDLIRAEDPDSECRGCSAMEYVAKIDGDRCDFPYFYLLDRPTPAVDLPTEPTLGWVVSKYGGSALGTWERHEPTRGSLAGEVTALAREREAPLDVIRGFVEAVAVPKAALDELGEAYRDGTSNLTLAVAQFAAAVDAANGDPR